MFHQTRKFGCFLSSSKKKEDFGTAAYGYSNGNEKHLHWIAAKIVNFSDEQPVYFSVSVFLSQLLNARQLDCNDVNFIFRKQES